MGSSTEHPLIQRELTYIHDYDEWRTLVEEAEYAEQLHGLLHIGFSVPMCSREEAWERIILYLQFADGHLDPDTFKTSDERARYRWCGPQPTSLGSSWPSGTLCAVAQKAFTMLCKAFFGNSERREYQVPGVNYRPSWEFEILYQPVLETVLWFLRLNEGPIRTRGLRNLDGYGECEKEVGRHYLKMGEAFAFDLARYIFRRNDEPHEDYRKPLNEFKPAAIDILYGLGKLDILLHDGYPNLMDRCCLQRMQELAMRAELYTGSHHRAVESLEEACLAGSQAAKILLLLRTMRKAQDRLDKIQTAQYERDEAERRLKRLTS